MASLQKSANILSLLKIGVLLFVPAMLIFFNHSYPNVNFLVYGQTSENNNNNNTFTYTDTDTGIKAKNTATIPSIALIQS